MRIEKINSENIKEIKRFIRRIPGISEINEEILNRVLILRNDFEIKAIISYECFSNKGLIRYFIFHKDVDFEELEMLVEEMIKNTKEESINLVLTVIDDESLVPFFEKLGFHKCLIENVYIGEVSLENTLYHNAIGLVKES
ncbi:MAG: hypothetical protein IJX78_04125 [Bacilli bacterium]|nr:hypothetical protein [Bacilli bacterium]